MPPTDLPVEAVVGDVRQALGDTGHAVLVAPPGAGKTTVVPIRLLAEPWLADQRIVVLEPRRLAARAAARRMAELLGEPVGRTVGYRTRDERVVSRDTHLEVITEGILVRRLQSDPSLDGTGLVVLDEVHERNLVTDLSLAFLLDARRSLRPDLRVLAMSATVDAGRLATTLGGAGGTAPVVASDGRQHPVALRWWPPEPRDRPEQHAARVVARALAAEPEGDVLVFLPGAAEIGRVARALTGLPDTIDVRPLYGALPVPEQDRALAPSPAGRRRVVLATDIAESSLTVAGVRIVVDAGLVRSPRFDAGTGLTRLVTSAASRAAADQRSGRAGRLGPGVAHRLWSAGEHGTRPAFPEPEIAVVDLAALVLEVAVWGGGVGELPFLDPPPARAWAEGRTLLRSLGALDDAGRPTATGRAMVDLPLHPRLARMVVDGGDGGRPGGGWAAAVVAAVLDERDVLGGRRDERVADLAERVAVVDGDRDGPATNRDAVRSARRRSKELGRRLDRRPGRIDPTALGPLIALAYPDRIAQARGGGRFRLRGGGGGWLPDTDPLASAPYLAVADLDVGTGDGR
ncbi:MAG: putative ATP-dependent helicase, partial [Acidimicrobiales bacterium]|nr:putative ATP-dependent helicase [Acidimicrobiales bacterium]